MRGTDQQQIHVFSYISPEQRVRQDHPLRPIRTMVDEILKQLSSQFDKIPRSLCASAGICASHRTWRKTWRGAAAPLMGAPRNTRATASARRKGSASRLLSY
jgi:hypothetical protein